MDLNFIWKAIVIVFGGVLVLRVAGRKSISQLTVAQTVMMVAVGSLIIQPVNHRNIWVTLLITFIMVLTLIIIEFLALKFDKLESFFYSKSIMIIENGQMNEKNMKKLRLTVDMLEVRLRLHGVISINDVQWATIESNGQLGYLLKPEKQFATKEDIQQLMSLIQSVVDNTYLKLDVKNSTEDKIFKEVKNSQHVKEPPEYLK
ncbi:DUF421 domain-containing protein [Bacillus sp. 31A1R]|uniref:DUF421 domain-containing protein n=1 Tax=Robertmurraya mangrovi TaxID=3098077 RepID=A0ABU5IWH3_9BACI|nr:DUF421 domain-containing protein [Bacillus sp. 31A1R]MDZ5471500.1 DUF421 domain-containing protein [Bacillus sp. 31A1R]